LILKKKEAIKHLWSTTKTAKDHCGRDLRVRQETAQAEL